MQLNITNIFRGVCVALLGAGTLAGTAQNTQTGYFLDGYTYRFQMNPAMANERNFVSMPALANVNLGIQGNLHLRNVLYNVDGKTTTFLNPGVSVQEAMSGFSDMNKIGANVGMTLLGGGFKAWGGYNTVAVNMKTTVNAGVPYALFSLLKEGVANTTYDISDFNVRANAYAEIAFGHSRQITPEWRVGGTLKFLLGGGNVDARFNDAQLTLGENDWTIRSDAQINASVKGLTYKTKFNSHTGNEYVSGAKIDGAGLNGFGMALDAGVVYQPKALKDWTFSFAVLDFGFIGWSNNMVATTNGPKTFNTDKYTFSVDDDASNSFSNEWKVMRDDLTALYELENKGDAGSRTTMLNATFNIGAQYTFPLYRPLTFGLLNTTRAMGKFTTTDFRLSANVAPVDIFSASANIAMGTYGFSFGWMANLHVTGFNFFVGMDHTTGKLAKQGVPLSSNMQVNLGMNFLF